MHDANLVTRIDRLLPQTQCRRCGYAGCRPYAEAIAKGQADINRCPPGGDATIAELARLLEREVIRLDVTRGTHQAPVRAVIDEATCIGCTKCIQACPVDAIVGAARLMHTVLADECTGCELCVAPCPVDCIDLVPTGADVVPATDQRARERADRARARYEWRTLRLARDAAEREAARHTSPTQPARLTLAEKRAAIQAAVARVKARRAARTQS
ncbi:MAG: RnfABCDGE type electron transport complex subunit B [Gammaproteobacteria bacterium]